MKEWIHRLLFEYDSFGGLIFNYFIILFVFMFCWLWISMILNSIIYSIIEKNKEKEEGKNGYNVRRDLKYDKLYKKIEGILEIPLLIPVIIIKYIKEFIEKKLNVDLSKNKSLIQWFIGFIIITSIWINWTDPFNDFMLLTKGIEVEGVITKSKQESEIVEINDGRSRREEFKFTYSYDYETKERYTLTNTEEVNGEEPEEFLNLDEDPIKVKVTYLESNPKYSRVFKYTTNNKSIYGWFRYTLLYLVIFLSLWSYLIYKSSKD
jgi:hypothetical protein